MEKQATKRENWKTYTQKEKTIKETKYKNIKRESRNTQVHEKKKFVRDK